MSRNVARVFDEYLVVCARAGDRAALGRLVKYWQPKLLAHAYRLTGDVEIAKDVAQDGWADILKGLPGLKESTVFPAWAYRIVTRRAVDRIRRAQRKRRTEAAFAAEPSLSDRTSEKMEIAVDRTPITCAIAELSTSQRVVIALFYLEELSVTEISVALEVPAGTVKTRLMHARRKLRAYLEGEDHGRT
ncbi:MAG: RNA polymerase subunit sigma-70 [Robiginitomaculum sp.]|nr:MAG: RNA polymerase subunit sigma-70 [Robiginitomaculum sp.]